MISNRMHLLVLNVVALLLLSCTPKGVPASSPPPASRPTAPATSAPGPNTATPGPDRSSWDRTIEAAKKEGTLTVYSFWWVGDQSIAISRAFRQRHGINVQIITGRGAEFLERLKVEKRMGTVTADVFEGSATHSQNVKIDGLLGSVADLPMLQDKAGWNVNPLIFDPSAFILLHRPWIMVPFVNTNLVKTADVPRTWNDLILPRWKGKMSVPDPNVSNSTYYLLLLVRPGHISVDAIRQLGQQELQYVKDSSDAGRALARGDALLLPNATDSSMVTFAQSGAPIKAVEVDKGTIVSGGVMDWVKDGPHPNAARVFINWILSDEGQRVESEAAGTMPLRQSVPDPRHPAIQVRVNQPVVIGVEENEEIAKAFREKTMVNLLMKTR